MLDPSVIFGLFSVGSTIVGGTAWAVRLEGRQTAHEAVDQKREELADERHKDVKDALEALDQKLAVLSRIESTLNQVARRV